MYAAIPGTPRSSVGFISHEGQVYYLGGHAGKFHFYAEENFTQDCSALDLATGKWRMLKPLPVKMQGYRVAADGDSLFLFGGFRYFGDTDWPVRSTNSIWRYSISNDAWHLESTMPFDRSSHVLGQVGDLVYLIGGWHGRARPKPDPQAMWESTGPFYDTIDVFSLASLSRTTSHPLQLTKRRAFSAVSAGKSILVAGGLGERGFSDLVNEVAWFDTESATWSQVTPKLPKPLFSPSVAFDGHKPLVVGGLFVSPDHSEYQEYSDVRVHDPKDTGGWPTKGNLSSPRTFAESTYWGDKLIVFGGHSGELPTDAVDCVVPAA